jgi:uroporphyrinogen decarboxylase
MQPALNMKDWQKSLIRQNKRLAMPIMTHPGIQLCGRRVIDAVTKGDVHFQAIKAIAEEYPAIAATMIMDLTVEAEAFGSTISFADDEVPSVASRLVSDIKSVEALMVPDMNAGRVPEYLIAARLAAGNIQNKPVFGGCIGPFSLAGRLYDMTEIMTAAFLEPDMVSTLLEKCTSFIFAYISALKKTGIHGIIMAEPAAGLLDESLCDAFSSSFIKRIVAECQDDHFLVILHNCGNTGHLTKSMLSAGCRGLHFGNRINMKTVLEEVPQEVIVLGNLDPVEVFKMSSPSQVKQHVTQLLEETHKFPNFVLSSGCDTPPGVPLENIRAFYDALETFNKTIA